MSAQQVIDFTAAREARDAGMQQSLDHAQAVNPLWGEIAYLFLLRFARCNASFISEDVSDAANASLTFPAPPTDRAWGSVYRRAIKEGLIVQDGAGRSRRRHASICPRWRSLGYVGGIA